MKRQVSLTANISGEALGKCRRQIQQAIAAAGEPPKGSTVEVRGQIPPMQEMLRGLGVGLISGRGRDFSAAGGEFSIVEAGHCVGFDCAGGCRRRRADAVDYRHDVEHRIVHGSDHGDRRRDGQQHSAGDLCRKQRRESAAAIAEGQHGDCGRSRGSLPAIAAYSNDIGRDDCRNAAVGDSHWAKAANKLRHWVGRLLAGLAMATLTTLFVLPCVFALIQSRAKTASASLDPDDSRSLYFDQAEASQLPTLPNEKTE